MWDRLQSGVRAAPSTTIGRTVRVCRVASQPDFCAVAVSAQMAFTAPATTATARKFTYAVPYQSAAIHQCVRIDARFPIDELAALAQTRQQKSSNRASSGAPPRNASWASFSSARSHAGSIEPGQLPAISKSKSGRRPARPPARDNPHTRRRRESTTH